MKCDLELDLNISRLIHKTDNWIRLHLLPLNGGRPLFPKPVFTLNVHTDPERRIVSIPIFQIRTLRLSKVM